MENKFISGEDDNSVNREGINPFYPDNGLKDADSAGFIPAPRLLFVSGSGYYQYNQNRISVSRFLFRDYFDCMFQFTAFSIFRIRDNLISIGFTC